MIQDIKTLNLFRRFDDWGFYMDVLRDDEGLLKNLGDFSSSLASPGVIKAFHFHKLQDELWSFSSGNAQVVLYDLRENSPTKGETNVLNMGESNSILLYIPSGVAHGYRVLGERSAVINYYVSESYQPNLPDQYRLPWNDPVIGFDWELIKCHMDEAS